MGEEPTRKLDELVARYVLEPSLRDVFVEGPSDRAFLEHVLDQWADAGIAIYEIATVDMPPEVLVNGHLQHNNRGRLIGLALTLAAQLPVGVSPATCVIDTDFDDLLGITYGTTALLPTDYSCMEMYAFNEHALTTFFRVVARKVPEDLPAVVMNLAMILQNLFLIRLVNHAEELRLSHTAWHRCCTARSGTLVLDVDEYIRRHLNANGQSAIHKSFVENLDQYRLLLTSDPRNQINGHDFIALLCLYVRNILRSRYGNEPEHVERVIYLCVDRDEVQREGLFTRLAERVRSSHGHNAA